MKRILVIILLTCLTSGINAREKNKKPVIITGDNVKSKLVGVENGKNIYLTEITGHPKIKYGGTILRAKKIITRGNEGEISEAIGNVLLTDKESKSRVTSRKAIYYKLKNMVEFTGRPRILTYKKEDNSKVTIRAKRIEYNIDEKTGYAYGKAVMINKDTKIYSEKIIYKRNEGTAVFLDDPVIRRGEDVFKAEEIIYHVDKKSLILNKNAHAVTYEEEKDSETGKIKKIRTVAQGDRIENYEDGEKLTIIIGNESKKATIEREDTFFSGKRIEIIGEEGDVIKGNDVYINYITENVETNGENFNSHKKDGHSSLWGNACMVVKDETTHEESSRIYGDYMEFFQDLDELHIFGNIKIFCNAGIIKGNMARYQRSDKNMYITGNARIEKEDSILHSQKIIFNTRSNNTTMIGNIGGYKPNND